MIFLLTNFKVLDNSGAKNVRCIRIYNKGVYKIGSIGDLILVVLKKVIFKKNIKKTKMLKKGQLHKAIIVQTRRNIKRLNGFNLKFNNNYVVIMDKEGLLPVANRILGPVSLEIRRKGFFRVVLLAKFVI